MRLGLRDRRRELRGPRRIGDHRRIGRCERHAGVEQARHAGLVERERPRRVVIGDQPRALGDQRARTVGGAVERIEPARERVHAARLGREQLAQRGGLEARGHALGLEPRRCGGELGDERLAPAIGLVAPRALLGERPISLARRRIDRGERRDERGIEVADDVGVHAPRGGNRPERSARIGEQLRR